MLNHVVLIGRLTRDPEMHRVGSGTAVANFTIAVERDFANKETGEKETDFIDIICWRNNAEYAERNFHKGRMVCVSGRLQLRGYQDKDGNRRYTTEVVAENAYPIGPRVDGKDTAAPARRRSAPDERIVDDGGYVGDYPF